MTLHTSPRFQFELPACPALLTELSELMQDPDVSISRVVSSVEKDPGISAAILQTVNSSFYGLSKTVSSMNSAVTVLGLRELHSLACGAFLKRAFPTTCPEIEDLWAVSKKLAERASKAATTTRAVSRDAAYLLGLFRFVGCAVLLTHAPGYKKTFELFGKAGFAQAEREKHGATHGTVAASLVMRWGLSQSLVEVLNHLPEGPLMPLMVKDEAAQRLGAMSMVAELILMPESFDDLGRAHRAVAKCLGLDVTEIEPLLERVVDSL